MGENSAIEWTTHTWNPWQGCRKVSAGCAHCFMFREKRQYGQDPERIVRSQSATFRRPLYWHEHRPTPAYVFTCSWSDFFIEAADPWRSDAWDVIRQTPRLTYQILTKRPENIAARLPADWGAGWPNVWLGVTAENQQAADERIPVLLRTPAAIRFVSCEPLLSCINLRDYLGGRREERRAGISSVSGYRRVFGGCRRQDLASSANDRREPDGESVIRARTESAGACGAQRFVGIPKSHVFLQPGEAGCICASNRLDDPQQRRHSQWTGDQSQRRRESKQPSRQSGAGDQIGEYDPWDKGVGSEAEISERGGESVSQIDCGAGERNQTTLRDEGVSSVPNREAIRCDAIDYICDSREEKLGAPSISWLIAGCESGPNRRPAELDWFRALRDQCELTRVPFFLKQAEEVKGRLVKMPALDGRKWNQFPEVGR